MRVSKWLAIALWILASIQGAKAAEVIAGTDYLSVLSGPPAALMDTRDDFEVRYLGRTLLFAERTPGGSANRHVWAVDPGVAPRAASAAEWRRGQCMLLDHGPEMPGSLLHAPPDSAPLTLNGRAFAKSGPVWVGFRFSTNGSYLALFSTDARRLHRSDQVRSWAGDAGALEPKGQAFVDVYRVRDGVLFASGKYSFSGEPATASTFWLDSRILVVPAGPAAFVGVFPALPPETLPFASSPGAASGVASSCSDIPSAIRVTALRDEGVDDDHNGKFEGVRVIAKVAVSAPGPYIFVFELGSGPGQGIRSEPASQVFPSGVTEISAFFPAASWRKDGGTFKLTGIRFSPGERSRGSAFTASPPVEMRTHAWAAASFETAGSRYAPATVKVKTIDHDRDGLFDSLDIEIEFFAAESGPCQLHAYLGESPGPMGFDHASWSGDLKAGRNQVVFIFDARNFASHLRPQPFYLNGATKSCDDNPFTGPTNLPIKLPIIDFSRVKDAHCSNDLNNDGVVDDADLKLMLAKYAMGRSVAPGTDLYKDIVKLFEYGKGCHTR